MRAPQELDENHEAFMALLPELLQAHAGQWAVMRAGELQGIFESQSLAEEAGERWFADGDYALQQIAGSVLALKWFSCCGA